MDWIALQARQTVNRDMPARSLRLTALTAVLDNELYDCLPNAFSTEFGANDEYVPLKDRRPSVRTGLCRVVVDDTVSLLFSEGHWPTIAAKSENTAQSIGALVKDTRLNEVMLDAATRGSVGSVVIWLRVLKGKPFFSVLPTATLTPEWAADDPDRLVKVVERYKVTGRELAAQGYTVAKDDLAVTFWFQRSWDEADETWFTPQKIADDNPPSIDAARSVNHALGFTPMVWIRNLPGGSGPDGACTFEAAIDTMIEGDYLLSQAGRGLNYSSDPKTVLTVKGSEAPMLQGGSANALVLPEGGDAKLLEINGAAAKTVIEHVRELRAIALEAVHGNRAHPDKLSAATSGRAHELLMSGLIWTADRLRTSYGEVGLLSLLRMVCAASQVIEDGLTIAGQEGVRLSPDGLALQWPAWFPPTPQDVLSTAQGVVTAFAGGVISRNTAVTRMATLLGIDDVTAEIGLIEQADALKAKQAADLADKRLAAAQATAAPGSGSPDATAVRKDANSGRSETNQTTA